jgi:AcrR family transcriptional regulator
MAGQFPPPAALPDVDSAGASSAGASSAGDGRRLRRDRNRMAVVDALLDLYSEWNLRPSTAEIAERAGLSHRSLFRYFDDFEDLCREAISRAELRALPLVRIEADPAAPLEDRIDALVTQRLRLFEALGPVALVSRLNAPFAEVLAAELTKNRAFLRGQLADLFAPELHPALEADAAPEANPAQGNPAPAGVAAAGAGGGAGRDAGGGAGRDAGGGAGRDAGGGAGRDAGGGNGPATLAAVDVLCSFESYLLLSRDQGLSGDDIRAVLISALTALLNPLR